ncbi:twin-arginine translocase TatA/TatE family subunit [Reyranella sp.]|jgi:sec-independent protein translocase protein TatA|uniref:twin-arginine translocase TatA/TatE family subunit n=1 Tax=Reyranella sp. TaxID=1929291 RepID=UPI0013BE4FC5|nr:MAG: sec-independent protein translocase protein TatA [Rhodospirillaceae bacterium]
MGSFSIWHWLIVLAVVLLLFGGRGKVSQLMGDFGKGLSAFKKGVGGSQEETPPQAQPGTQPGDSAKPISAQATTTPPGGTVHHQDSAAKI